MKKIVSLVLVLCLIFTLLACSADITNADGSKADASKAGNLWGFDTKPDKTPVPTSTATFKDPEPKSVVATEKWGNIAVNQMAVVFEDGVDRDTAAGVLKQIGGIVVGELDIINLYQLETAFTTEAELTAAMDAARVMDGVELVFPNAEVYLMDIEGKPCSPLNDQIFENPNNSKSYQMIGMENAWRIIKASGIDLNKVNVGMLDDSIYTGSNELNGKIKLNGDKTNVPLTDSNGQEIHAGMSHGTLVTHIIGADPENGGVTGIASILGEDLNISVKNLYDNEREIKPALSSSDDITKGEYSTSGYAFTIKSLVYLKQQVDNGATVINCSFGSDLPRTNQWINKAYEKFFKYIYSKNPKVVFVTAAGNGGLADKSRGGLDGNNFYPGGIKLPNVITVGAVNNDGSRAEFSNFAATADAEITLSAPGTDLVLGVGKDGNPIKSSGTSYATPQVTATVALLQAINPKLNAEGIKALLTGSADQEVTMDGKTVPIPPEIGGKLLKVDKAVLQAINDMRANQKPALEPYSLQQLLDMSAVNLTAAGGPKDFTLTAIIPNAKSGSTSVKIEVTGSHSMTGETTQNVAAGGSAVWQITVQNEPVFVRVVRGDTGTCAYMTIDTVLTNADLAGTWWCKGVIRLNDAVADIGNEFTLTPSGDSGGTVKDEGKGKIYTYTLSGNTISWSEGKNGTDATYYEFLWAITFTKAGGTITGAGLMTQVMHDDELGENRYPGNVTLVRPQQ
jgi:hypothetical protein